MIYGDIIGLYILIVYMIKIDSTFYGYDMYLVITMCVYTVYTVTYMHAYIDTCHINIQP